MTVYRLSPEQDLATSSTPPSPPRSRMPMVLAVTALAHVVLLGASAFVQPKAPPQPRIVDVLRWKAIELDDGEIGWKSDGLAKARVRAESTK